MLIDTHCHLDFPEFDKDRFEVIERARNQGINYIINIGVSLDGSRKSVELASQHACIYATVGIHPHEADRFNDKGRIAIAELAKRNKVVAIGEIGLDYFKNYSTSDNQRKLFRSLLGLAKDFRLAVVIHNRDAGSDTLKILKENQPVRAVVHCFSADKSFMQECLDLDFFISFTCNVTYKKAANLRMLLKSMPLERLMLETDAPFLPPEVFRGKRNEPMYVKLLAEEIARIKGISADEVAQATTENAISFFNLK